MIDVFLKYQGLGALASFIKFASFLPRYRLASAAGGWPNHALNSSKDLSMEIQIR